jgi:hypothetical protein
MVITRHTVSVQIFMPLHQVRRPRESSPETPCDRYERSAKPYAMAHVCPPPTSVHHLAVMLQRANHLNGNYTNIYWHGPSSRL